MGKGALFRKARFGLQGQIDRKESSATRSRVRWAASLQQKWEGGKLVGAGQSLQRPVEERIEIKEKHGKTDYYRNYSKTP